MNTRGLGVWNGHVFFKGRHKKEYRNIVVINIPDNISEDIILNLFNNIHKNSKGCWVRGDDSSVYTTIKYNNKVQQAHRVSYEIFKERIPDHLLGCHECDVKACINPEHIFPGSQALNLQDARIKGRVFPPKLKKSKWSEFPKLRKLLKGY